LVIATSLEENPPQNEAIKAFPWHQKTMPYSSYPKPDINFEFRRTIGSYDDFVGTKLSLGVIWFEENPTINKAIKS